jgi:sigma-B regulation protein RsbU (phosphoserine phosphatase)
VRHHDFLTGDPARDARNVDVLLSAVERMYRRANVEEVLRSAVEGALEVTGGERGVLLLEEDPDALTVRVALDRAGRDLSGERCYSRSVVDRVWRSGATELTRDTEEFGASLSESQKAHGIRSVLAVPLRGATSAVGVLYVDSRAAARGFTDADRAVIETLAGLAVSAIEHARLARWRRSIEVAREIQRALAPAEEGAPEGWDLAFSSRPAEEISGDYHDVLPLADGSLCLVVGDAMGKGLGAALHVTSVRATLRTLIRTRTDPLSVFPELNAYACAEMKAGEFMTLVVARVDPGTGALSWVSAGQRSLLWRAGTGLEPLPATGPVLGGFPGAEFARGGPLAIGRGDALVLYTDGMTEAFDPSRTMYDEEGFEASVAARAARDAGARTLLAGLLADVRSHTGGTPPEDDTTCLVLRRL